MIPSAVFRRSSSSADTIGLVTPRKKTPPHGGFREGAGRKARLGEAADERITLRLTTGELARYQAAADSADQTLGGWIRAACEAQLAKKARRA